MNNAKYAFYYLLSLVALVFVAVNSGIIIFQIINKLVPDVLTNYSDTVNQDLLRFAIASLVFATPVYFWMTKLIRQGLIKAEIELNAGIRRWLTYFIIFVSSVVIMIWLIITLNSFLNGELSLKVILKTLTILVIAGSVFGYYFYDIKKKTVTAKDKITRIFFIGSLVLIVGIFVSAICFMDKPSVVRAERHDTDVINDFSQIDTSVFQYYQINKKLPVDLNDLRNTNGVYLRDQNLKDSLTQAPYQYKVTGELSYQLCATFKLATNKNNTNTMYLEPKWDHQAGEQCLNLVVIKADAPGVMVK